jgi:serine O-acetyltransferase
MPTLPRSDTTPTSASAGRSTHPLWSLIDTDFSALHIDGAASRIKIAIWKPGVRAAVLYRIQQHLERLGLDPLVKVAYALNHLLHGCEFFPGCDFGAGLVIQHPTGIVVGQGVVAGSSCTILHGVTLGERHADRSGDYLYPRVGDGVTFGCGSSVLGNVVVGDGAVVGAHALVIDDVPDRAVVGGIPARVLTVRPT